MKHNDVINIVTIGKLAPAVSQLMTIILIQQFLIPERANDVYQILSWSAIFVSISSFGANAALAKYVNSQVSDILNITTILLIIKAVVLVKICLIASYIFDNDILNIYTLLLVSMCLSMNFTEYIAEALGEKSVHSISLDKIYVYIIVFLIKLFLIIGNSTIINYLLYIEWPIILALTLFRSKSLFTFNISRKLICETFKFLKVSAWVWGSNIIQLTWSRGGFIYLSQEIGEKYANNYFIFIRVIEALAFVPNAVSMKYFSLILNEKSKEAKTLMKSNYIDKMILNSLFLSISVLVFVFLYMDLYRNEVDSNFVYLYVFISSVFFILRLALSREIVLISELKWSFYSYFIAMVIAGMFFYVCSISTMDGALLTYMIFISTAFLSPIILGFSSFKEFNKCIGHSIKKKLKI